MAEPIDLDAARSRNQNAEDKARDYKARSLKILGDLVDLMREAEREDYRIEWLVQRDQLGMPYFLGPTIVKRFP